MEKRQVMDNGRIVGIDIGRYDVQISILIPKAESAETISTTVGEEKYEIPLCLFQEPDSKNWYYGEKARQNLHAEQGVYIEDLWEGALGHREIVLEEGIYSYDQLMGIFVDKLLNLLAKTGYGGEITALVFAVEDVNYEKIVHLKQITQHLPIDFRRIFFIDYKESFGAYVTREKKELWNHEVFLFYYMERRMKAFGLHVNQKVLPFRIQVGEVDYGELEYCREDLEDSEEARVDMDSRFQATIQELFAKRVVSCVYLIGDGFQSGWMKESLRLLCRGRRVFQGNNLFTKGACYAGEWYLQLHKPAGEYQSGLVLDCDIRIPVLSKLRARDYLYVGRVGEPWYHAGMEKECTLEEFSKQEEPQIQVEIVYPTVKNGKAIGRVETLSLSGFPSRPKRASKVYICVTFSNEYTGQIRVEDLGLGEFYPTSGLSWEMEFQIKEKAANE